MKKRIILLITLLLIPFNVLAASGSIKPSVSSTKVTLNNTVTVTVKVSSSDTLGSWQYGLSYDKSKLSLISGDTNIVGYGDGTYKSKSYTYKFRAIATGSATITIDNPKIIDWTSETSANATGGSLTLTIKEPVVINYSSDNNLKSLTVEGFSLSPEFNKSTLSYNVTVLATTTKVNINASVNDSKAKVSGTGEKDVVEGTNTFEIVVTAENGTTKTYTINVVVPEKDPVKYVYNNEEYSVLRKLPEVVPNNFNTSTIKINEEEVACLQNEKLNLTLIYLRDKNNKEGFYIYNNNSLTLYNEVNNKDFSIYLTNPTKELDHMIKTTLDINEEKISAYQIREGSKDYIIYGTDTSTGKSNFYVYDKDNKTISIFNNEDFNYLLNGSSLYKIVTFALAGLIVILIIIIILINNSKKKLSIMVKKLSEENTSKKKKNK